jgi:hypothetical protein
MWEAGLSPALFARGTFLRSCGVKVEDRDLSRQTSSDLGGIQGTSSSPSRGSVTDPARGRLGPPPRVRGARVHRVQLCPRLRSPQGLHPARQPVYSSFPRWMMMSPREVEIARTIQDRRPIAPSGPGGSR